MSTYEIIDEPKVKASSHLVVNPIVILLAAMIVPMFLTIPFFGRWWLPFVWLMFNGYILGSPTLIKEIILSLVGLVSLYLVFELSAYLKQIEPFLSFESFFYYVRIILYGVFFLFLYLVVFRQIIPFEIFLYMKKKY
ncbi:hypothetical protein [Pleionea sediminis]|uniref:hypothetical protein n=1 Tax=Pleionea sediminis TaxID=2569479 RepID=UPI001185756E|nr:hypothetical protein [Pleionea sediminis]